MIYLNEAAVWTDKISLIEKPEKVIGGVGGVANRQAQEFANRTTWLKEKVDNLGKDKVNITDFDTAIKALQQSDKDIYKYIRGLIYMMHPVGSRRTSHIKLPQSEYWVDATGEWFAQPDYPELWAAYLAEGRPIVNNLMQITDERGTVTRAQNKGRFVGLEETLLGGYQADATQKIVGINNWQFMLGSGQMTGPFGAGNHSGYHGNFSVSTALGQGAIGISFDNSRVARTATEERVKSTTVHVQIFCGLGDL